MAEKDLLLLSAGDFYGRPGIIEMYRSRFLAETMIKMNYTAVALGERELNHGLRTVQSDAGAGLPIICANLYFNGDRPFPPAVIKEVNGNTVGIFALLDEMPREIGELEIRDPAGEGVDVIEELKEKGCNVIILLAHMRRERLVAILDRFSDVDLVIRGHGGGRDKVTDDCADTLGGTFENLSVPVMFAGDRGRAVGRVEIVPAEDGGPVVTGGRAIHLDESFSDDSEVASMLEKFIDEEGIRQRRMSLAEFLTRDEVTGRIRERYLGFENCMRCHSILLPRFIESRHFRAFAILEVRDQAGNPKCLKCHTTGYGRYSGYDPRREETGDTYLRGVQCEACHGPGTMHSRDGAYVESARNSCRACHTAAWSPDFDFETFWKRGGHCAVEDSLKRGDSIRD